jgi:hypothetical protein
MGRKDLESAIETIDCREDARGLDPDSHSPTLRRYHQFLWSKPLPNGKVFKLDISGPKPFLVHRSELGEFQLTSDSITHSYKSRPTIKPLVQQLPDHQKSFAESEAWVVAECIVFPGKRMNGKSTINGARGMNRKIGDRFDLTLECIRRHYRDQKSPLSDVLERYSTFFALFEDFRGYVDFFLLEDLICDDYQAVNFYLPFDDFRDDPLPHDVESYASYLSGVMRFAKGRAQRILQWRSSNFSLSE